MKYKIIASGSSGNSILLDNGILLDCGVPFKAIEGVIHKIKAVFISHEHHDHMNLSTIKKIHDLRPTVRFIVGFWLKQCLLSKGINAANIDVIEHGKVYKYNTFRVMPFILIHDVKNYGIKIIDMQAKQKIFYAVDTNRIDHIVARNFDLYLIEGNYDEDKLEENIKNDMEQGLYSYGLRVKNTHLSVQKASEWLIDNMGENSGYEFIHQSKNNL
jgi:phosphoribosyl 1,2-cyclic phosphodiesterase